MATTTTVRADPNAPAIARQLAQFAVGHRSRARVEAMVDNSIDEASADIRIQTIDGRPLDIFIKRAIGSAQRTLSQARPKARFVDQGEPVLGREPGRRHRRQPRSEVTAPGDHAGGLSPAVSATTLPPPSSQV